MKTLAKTALLAMGLALASQGAHAAANDLILGFNQQGVSAFDYTVNLGNFASSVGVGGTGIVDLSAKIGSLSAANGFNSAFTGGPNGVAVGVVGGNNGSLPRTVFATSLRTQTGNPASAAGSVIPTTINGATLSSAAALPNGIVQYGKLASSDSSSWSTLIAPSSTDNGSSTYASTLNYNPLSVISGSSIVQDLWENTRNTITGPATGWAYLGYFTLNFIDANNASLTFTPSSFVPVPEPATYGALAGLGLLALCLRRQLTHKTA